MCLQISEMELDCPGCCGESFKCRETLKKHLLQLLDKLRCSQCNLKFNDLLTLANHLDECCDVQVIEKTGRDASAAEHDEIHIPRNQESVSVYSNQEQISELVEATCPPDLELQTSEIGQNIELHNENIGEVPQSSNMEEFGLNVLIKNELAESTNLQEQQLTLLDNDGQSHILIMSQDGTLQEQDIVTIQNDDGTVSFRTPMEEEPKTNTTEYMIDDKLNQEEGKESDEDVEIYSCNTCAISFTSVHEHIRKFHSDQDVVVEVAEVGAEDHDELSSTSHKQSMHELNIDTSSRADTGVQMREEQQQIEKEHKDMSTKRVITESGDIVEAEFKNGKVLVNVGGNIRTNNAVDKKSKRLTLPGSFMEQQCVDKDGRVYTRRLVQIEKFWEDKELEKEVETPQEMPVEENCEEGTHILGDCESGVTTVYHCALCYTQHLTMAEFDTHVCKQPISGSNKYTDPSLQVYSCDLCSVTYSSLKSLCAHKKIHKKPKSTDGKRINVKSEECSQNALGPFKCAVCDTVFPTNKSLRLHRRMHDPVKMRTIEAPVEYPSSMDCEPLVRDPLDKYHCNICDKWIHVGYQRIHDKYHATTQDYNCDICNRKFYTEENLVMHMNVHTTEKILPQKSDKLLPYNCLYCPRQFARPHEKVKHERIHTGEKPHSCEICGKSFRVSYCLTLHMRTHTGARPYVCTHCGKRFKAHSVYNHHLLTHSEVRAYKCPYCPKAFKTSVQLAGHKNSHTKPFSCTECNRPFASLYAVRVHTETHKRQNNLKFSCEMCGASYARAFALKDHMRAQHAEHHSYVQLVEVEVERERLGEQNSATMSIMPKIEHSIEVEELTLGADDEQEMELLQ